jgi:hypothetical protein
MASAQKKVIVRQFEAGLAWGYLPQTHLLDTSGVSLMDIDGRIKCLYFNDIKTIAYVKDFNLDDTQDPERLGRRAFATRPKGDGLWLRLILRDGDTMEGLSSVDIGWLDSLIDDRGLFLTPPDARSNTQRLFIPRPAIASLEVLGLIMAPARRALAKKPAPTPSTDQPGLFND